MPRITSILGRLRPRVAGATLLGLSVLSGCAFQEHREQLAQLHLAGNDLAALQTIEAAQQSQLYGQNDRLIYLLDHGALMLESGQQARAIDDLERAEKIMDYGGNANPGDELTRWLINDAAAPYVGEPYESVYVNVLKLLAQLTRTDTGPDGSAGTQGIISGGATVEARRAAAKADWLRNRYNAWQSAIDTDLQKNGTTPQAAAGAMPTVIGAADPSTAGRFIESPLGTYLTAVTFMKAGESSLQEVAGRRLASSIQLQGPLIGNVNADAFANIGALRPTDANVLLVAFSGVGPTKVVQRVGPIPIYTWPLYFELPVLRAYPSAVARVRVTLTPQQPTEGNPPQVVDLNLVENLCDVAIENHKRQLPQIYLRTLIRASIRSGAAFAASQAVHQHNKNNPNTADAAALAVTLGGLVALAILEKADVRCWIFLPGQAHVALAKLPAGPFNATVEYLDANDAVVDTRHRDNLTAADGPAALATVLTYTQR